MIIFLLAIIAISLILSLILTVIFIYLLYILPDKDEELLILNNS